MVIDPEVCYDLNGRISTHVNDKRMQKSKSAHQNHRRGHQNSKNDIWRYRRSLTLDDLSVPRKGHDIIISVQTMDITPRRAHPRWHAQRPIDVHITSKKKNTKKRQVRKLLALKRYERKFRWHDLESRSQVKQRSWQVQSWDFHGRCKFSKIRLHNILLRSAESSACYYRKTRGGVAWTPVPTCVPLKPMTHMYLNYGYTPSPEMVKLTKWLRQTSLSWWKRVIQK